MTIALPFENNNIFDYYEHASSFKLYEIEHGKIAKMRFIPINDLADIKIDIMLCGNIGDSAMKMLILQGIDVHTGFSGNADVAVRTFLSR